MMISISINSASARMGVLLLALLCAVHCAFADAEATTSAEQEAPEWATDSAMQLMFTGGDDDDVPFQYTVIPLTENLGLNESERYRKVRLFVTQISACDD